ncbi:MAG: thiol-activated cytolysin family protein [Flavobacteriales bacterium]|nr:thiol-activated cytolysin family protein [Flavobacteriales bacterium]
MKKLFQHLSIALFSTAVLISCVDKENDSNTQKDFSSLQRVSFEKSADKLVSSEDTGQLQYDASSSSYKKVFRKTYEKSFVVSEPSVLKPTSSAEIIYPGSILSGSSFLEHNYDPIVLSNPYKEVTLSMSLKGSNYPVTMNAEPTLSSIRFAINQLLAGNKEEIEAEYIPSDFTYQSDSISHEESFNKSFSTHVDFNVMGGLVKADFNYETSSSYIKKQSYILVKLNQKVYSASIDPKHYTDWAEGTFDISQFGSHEPVYISNVEYGRSAYFLIESNLSKEEASKMLNASVSVALKAVTGSVSVSYSEEFKKLFAEQKIRVKVVGGPTNKGILTNYSEFMDFIKNTTTDELIKSSAPISYTVRRLKDNTKVEIVELYKETKLELED